MSPVFTQTSSKKNVQIEVPFGFRTGAVDTVSSDSTKAWRNKVFTVIATERGSRVWYDRYGAAINTLIYENVDTAVGMLKEAISEAFIRWIPEVSLSEVLYNYDRSNAILTFSVYYTLPDGTEDRVTITQNSTTGSGDLIQAGYLNG